MHDATLSFLRVSYAYKVFYIKYVCLYLNFRIAEANHYQLCEYAFYLVYINMNDQYSRI